MDIALSQLFLYIILLSLTTYLAISIYRKELPILIIHRMPGMPAGFNLKGWRAIFISVFFLFIFIPFLIIKFNLIFFLVAFIIGIPVAFISHRSIRRFYKNNPAFVSSNKLLSRKIEISNLVLYGIVGVLIGFFTFMLANIIFRIVGFSDNLSIILSILVFLVTVILTAQWGARTNWTRE